MESTSSMHVHEKQKHTHAYMKFAAMVATSTVIMFGLMYLNTFSWSTSISAKHEPIWL